MKYRCQMCKGFERGADTREGFVEHMRLWHGVPISVEDLLYLEGLTPNAPAAKRRSEAMKQAWARRRAQQKAAQES